MTPITKANKMNKPTLSVLLLALLLASCAPESTAPSAAMPAPPAARADPAELARWEQQASDIIISRDKWGIAHIYGKTDADTVFGSLYAQAEDDFTRVETNYINAMGRLAEAEGEAGLFRDLRMKLFIDPGCHADTIPGKPGLAKVFDECLR